MGNSEAHVNIMNGDMDVWMEIRYDENKTANQLFEQWFTESPTHMAEGVSDEKKAEYKELLKSLFMTKLMRKIISGLSEDQLNSTLEHETEPEPQYNGTHRIVPM
ncbi:MAG: hypothetical protein KUG81_09730 [Gammaproteobacteria bacterium]|nr:hypothetical protein [Gammaproteobacteria bacterium]